MEGYESVAALGGVRPPTAVVLQGAHPLKPAVVALEGGGVLGEGEGWRGEWWMVEVDGGWWMVEVDGGGGGV